MATLSQSGAANGRLQILAVYTDTDLAAWQKHLAEMPKDWIAAHDDSGYLYAHGIYDLRAIPSIYLLDKNKKVLLKD